MRISRARRALLVTVGGLVLCGFTASSAAAQSFEPPPGSVVIRDRMGESDAVLFYFPVSGSLFVEERIALAAERASIPNRGIEEDETPVEGARLFVLETTIGIKMSFLGRRIDRGRLSALDVFDDRMVILMLHPRAQPASKDVRRVGSGPFVAAFATPTGQTVEYRVPSSHLLQVLLFLIGIALVPYVILRWVAARVRRGSMEDVDKVYRLRLAITALAILVPLALMGGGLALALLWVPDVLLAGVAPSLTRSAVIESFLGLVALIAVYLLALVPGYRAIGPLYRELRGIDARATSRATRIRQGSAFAVPLLIWLVAINLLNVQDNALARAIGDVVLLVLILALSPLVVARLLPTRKLEGPLRSRLEDLFRQRGVRVRDVRVWQTGSEKVGNAMVLGAVPRLRYVILTDYLVDNLDKNELEAVVAHEMGHAKQHHVLLKLLALVGVIVVVAAGSIALSVVFRGLSETVVALAIPIAFVVGLLAVQGWLGLVLERKADDYGADRVGVEPMAAALERLGEINMMKRRTGWVWNVLNQHPGLEQRIGRLRRRAPADSPTPA